MSTPPPLPAHDFHHARREGSRSRFEEGVLIRLERLMGEVAELTGLVEALTRTVGQRLDRLDARVENLLIRQGVPFGFSASRLPRLPDARAVGLASLCGGDHGPVVVKHA